MKNYNYKIRYGVLDSTLIFNECGPFSGGPPGWDEEAIKKREEKGLQHIAHQNKVNNFFNKIEESVLKEGFRNPILVDCGMCAHILDRGIHPRLPIEMQEDHTKILTCNSNGGSRLWVAQNHNLEIPCIISDFVDRFTDFKLLETREDIFSCYRDRPQKIRFNPFGLRLRLLPQTHME